MVQIKVTCEKVQWSMLMLQGGGRVNVYCSKHKLKLATERDGRTNNNYKAGNCDESSFTASPRCYDKDYIRPPP